MSKMDGLRAMREARFEQQAARAAKAAPTWAKLPPVEPVEPVAPAAPVAVREESAGDEVEVDSLCGHRAISGRTCTRERGHSAKSHRYS